MHLSILFEGRLCPISIITDFHYHRMEIQDFGNRTAKEEHLFRARKNIII